MHDWNWLDANNDGEWVEVKKSWSDDELMAMLREEGCTGVRLIKNRIITFRHNEISYHLGNNKDLLELAIGYNDLNLSPRKINQWNVERSLGKVFIDEESRFIAIQFALITESAGVSQQQIIAFIKKAAATNIAFRIFASEEC